MTDKDLIPLMPDISFPIYMDLAQVCGEGWGLRVDKLVSLI